MFYVKDAICGALDIGINIFFYVVLCLVRCLLFVQGVLLLGIFSLVLLVIGELQSLVTSQAITDYT